MIAFVAAAVFAPQLVRLGNGIPVIIETIPGASTVSVEVQVDAGGCSATEMGELEFLAAAMFGESENRSLRTMRSLAWQIGGAIGSDVTQDALRFHVRTSKAQLRPVVAFLSDVLRKPAFTEESLRMASNTLSRRDKRMGEDLLGLTFRVSAFDMKIGPGSAVSLSKEQATSAHARLIVPERIAIAVVGDVQPDEIARLLGGTLGGWVTAEPIRARQPRMTGVQLPADVSGFTFVMEGPDVTSQGFASWMVLVSVLGMGKSSRINQVFREESGWSYLNGARIYPRLDRTHAICSVFRIGSGATPNVKQLQSEISEPEFLRAKAYLLGRLSEGAPDEPGRVIPFGQGNADQEHRAYWSAWWQLRTNGRVSHRSFLETVGKVTLADVREQAADCLSKATARAYKGTSQNPDP